ncbi:hypothetical protein B0H34DRAFT_438639 [Crassisporium funariophilum]|nr:hypothetical protein B0H34DRAFT_438639 [Crassisporium funariophilum]
MKSGIYQDESRSILGAFLHLYRETVSWRISTGMGSRGYKVYHYLGWYHVTFYSQRSHPWALGLEVLSEIPRCPELYLDWLERRREQLEKDLDVYLKGDSKEVDANEHGNGENDICCRIVTKHRPRNSSWIEWIYGLDLENELFLVDNQPLFRLDNMPPADTFLSAISLDSYGHRAYNPAETPAQHRYDYHQATSDPKLPDAALADGITTYPVHDVLGVPQEVQEVESLRIHVLQIMIGSVMRCDRTAAMLRYLKVSPPNSKVPVILSRVAVDIVRASINPLLFDSDGPGCSIQGPAAEAADFHWLRPDVCLHITSNLHSESTAQECDSGILHEISLLGTERPRTAVYAVVFSFLHCFILRVDPDGTHQRTPILSFLPSFYATTPYTDGIAALARFGFWLNQLPNTELAHHRTPSPPLQRISSIPVEVWLLIAEHLPRINDVQNMVYISRQSEKAARMVLRYPHYGKMRFMKVVCDTQRDADDLYGLAAATFEVEGYGGGRRLRMGHQEVVGLPDEQDSGLTPVYVCGLGSCCLGEVDDWKLAFAFLDRVV